MKRMIFVAMAAASLMMLAAGTALASVVTFSGGTFNGPTQNDVDWTRVLPGGSYTESGMTVQLVTGNTWDEFTVGDWEGTEDSQLHTHTSGSVYFDMGGAAFDLLGFNLTTNLNNAVLTTSNGGWLSLPYEDWGNGFTTISLNGPWYSGITSFSLLGNGTCLGVDDVDFSSTVPEPSTFLLLGAGFVGLGIRRRKFAK